MRRGAAARGGLPAGGSSDAACRWAAEAWSLVRRAHAEEAERLNGLLHALVRFLPAGNGGGDGGG